MPRLMIAFERFDVVVAPFPFSDMPVRKPRPVLVLSNAAFNKDHGHLIGAMITTGARSSWPSDHEIGDLASAGLDHRSVVRWKVFTLPLQFVSKKIGMLSPNDRSVALTRTAGILLA